MELFTVSTSVIRGAWCIILTPEIRDLLSKIVSFRKWWCPGVLEKKVHHIITWIWCSTYVGWNFLLIVLFSLLGKYWFLFICLLCHLLRMYVKSPLCRFVCSPSCVNFCFLSFDTILPNAYRFEVVCLPCRLTFLSL